MAVPQGQEYIQYLLDLEPILSRFKHHSLMCLNLKKGEKILDAGCGIGLDLPKFSKIVGNHNVYGLDKDELCVQEAKKNYSETNISCGDLSSTGFNNYFFDAVHMNRVLMHVWDPEKIVQEMKRILKPQGRIVVSETCWSKLTITNAQNLEALVRRALINTLPSGKISEQIESILARNFVINTKVIHSFDLTYNQAFWILRVEELKQKITAEELKLFNSFFPSRANVIFQLPLLTIAAIKS